MSDNSTDWKDLLSSVSDGEELMSSIFDDKADDHQNSTQQLPEINKAPTPPKHQIDHINADQDHDQNVKMITTNGWCLINPLGSPYGLIQPLPVAVPLGSLQGLMPQNGVNVHFMKLIGRKRMIEDSSTAEDEQRKRLNKIKNRLSAARSRQKKLEHKKFLERKVEELKDENAYMKKLLALEEAAEKKRKEREEEKEAKLLTKAERAPDKWNELRRTLSSPC